MGPTCETHLPSPFLSLPSYSSIRRTVDVRSVRRATQPCPVLPPLRRHGPILLSPRSPPTCALPWLSGCSMQQMGWGWHRAAWREWGRRLQAKRWRRRRLRAAPAEEGIRARPLAPPAATTIQRSSTMQAAGRAGSGPSGAPRTPGSGGVPQGDAQRELAAAAASTAAPCASGQGRGCGRTAAAVVPCSSGQEPKVAANASGRLRREQTANEARGPARADGDDGLASVSSGVGLV